MNKRTFIMLESFFGGVGGSESLERKPLPLRFPSETKYIIWGNQLKISKSIQKLFTKRSWRQWRCGEVIRTSQRGMAGFSEMVVIVRMVVSGS